MTSLTSRQITSTDVPAFTSSGGSESLTLAAWLAGLGRVSAPPAKTFWSDEDGGGGVAPNVWRMRDRVFVGNAALLKDSFANDPTEDTWASSDTVAPIYPLYSAQMAVMHERGGTAITGYSRMSDKGSQVGLTGIGVAGIVIGDKASTRSWGGYFEVQFEQGMNGYAIELDAKNKSGVDISVNPYSFPNGGTYGAWIAAGGDSTQGGAPTNPSAAAIVITNNTHTWNAGIVIKAGALTGNDGSTSSGSANAIILPVKHKISWLGPSGVGAASINSSIINANKQIGISFQEDALYITGNEGTPIAIFTRSAGSPVNYIQLQASATGVAAQVYANGETNTDLYLRTKGTGVVQFGTHTVKGAETVTGYITMKDSGGTTRKIAILS